MASHADADRGPDHGRLARHERILADVADVATRVEEALGHVRAYRETVGGGCESESRELECGRTTKDCY